jgi:glycosyltransferase involved in cell wall biosynthesis
MKIVHVVDSMEVGGAETLVSQMCHLQREQGDEVEVYAIAALGELGERMRAEEFTVVANVGRHLADSTRNLYHLFRKSCPHVVHIHNPTPTIYAAPAARLAGAASIVSTRHSLVAPPHNRVAEFKYSIAARFCDWIVGICDATTQNIRSLHTVPTHKIARVYNGATPLCKSGGEKLPFRPGFTLVFVGRLQPVKNLSLLMNAFHCALESDPNLNLWIVGDGSERIPLEKQVADLRLNDRVTFWGQQLSVAPFFAGADAFIMSSKSEGLPVSLLQAFSLGLPSIVTDVGGMAEVVRNAKAGLVVPVQDPRAMAAAILRMKAQETERRQFSMNATAAFAADFSLRKMVDTYMDLYRSSRRMRKNERMNASFKD